MAIINTTSKFGTTALPQKPSFPVPDYLADSIDKLIDAIKDDDIGLIPLWEEQVRANARGLSDPSQETWVMDYYAGRRWLEDVTD